MRFRSAWRSVPLLLAVRCTPFGTTEVASTAADAGEADASPAPEAGSALDAGDERAVPGSFCANLDPPPRICATFDGPALDVGWAKMTMDGASLSRGSGPYAGMLVARAPAGCEEGAWAQLHDEANGAVARAEVEFDLSVVPMLPSPWVNIVGIELPIEDQPGFFRLDLAIGAGRLQLVRNGPGGYQHLVQAQDAFPSDETHRVGAVFDFEELKITVRVDGQKAIEVAFDPPNVGANTTALDFGMYVSPSCQGAPLELRFDNFVYRLTTR